MGSYGGIEAFCLELAKYVSSVDGFTTTFALKLVRGHEVDQRLKGILDDAQIPYRIVAKSSGDLLKLIRASDLVHAQNASPDIAVMTKLCNAKLVQTIHNHLYDRPFARTLSWKFGALLADMRLYNSQFVQHSWGYSDEVKDRVVPTVSRLEMNFAPIEQRRGFVFISRLIANKGADTLIEAYARASLNHAEDPLRIVGDGPMREPLQALAQRLGVEVDFKGFVDEDTKRRLTREARWLAAPANTREDMGLTPLEARANGIPVIATRDGGLPESAGPGALLCTPGNVDELARLLEQAAAMDSEEYQRLSKLGYSTLEAHLTPMDFYPALYRKLLAQ